MKRRILCVTAAVLAVICFLAVLAGCEDTDINGYIDSMYNTSGADSGSLALPGSDILPDTLVGTWSPTGIYQYAVASDISDEQALELEREHCIAMSYTSFVRYMDDISAAVYKINEKATFDELLSQGIQVDPLVEKYGEYAQITSVKVYDDTGAYCTTVFLVGGETLISYGAGMNVFSYERMGAEG